MILGYLYNNLNFPKDIIHKIFEFVGNDELTNAIKSIDIRMLNNKIIKFDLIRLEQIKLPIDAIFSNDVNNNKNSFDDKYLLKQIKIPTNFDHIHKNSFDYNNDEFVFETPFIKLITYQKVPLSSTRNPFILPIGINKLNNEQFDLWNNDEYNKLDYFENNLFLSFLLKFENKIFTQICKSNNFKKIKFISCVKAKKIPIKKISAIDVRNNMENMNITDDLSNPNDVDEDNVKGYSYEIKLKNHNAEYFVVKKLNKKNIIKKIDRLNMISDTIVQTAKFELKPYFVLFKETIYIGFNITKCFFRLV